MNENNVQTVTENDTISNVIANGYASAKNMPWVEMKPGVFAKTLFDGGVDHGRTLLSKLVPGAYSPPHAHDVVEQLYVIEGAFHDGERLLQAGDMCVREPGVVHESSSKDGAIVLAIYGPALR